ncbi:bacillithiol biosynthesis cysteine-adding enzyme BshC [Salisaeta longa]|uniref:bacillithiol biosynthesis cysteine-adding enzyme BshC n=1 Tax=Salisaeta longa TaxID=503170 RepID=UPI00040F945E|nr:bacillithiol biosynthesis cysteine-adding enzyme BshC [Salisaeta longa]
MPADTLPAIDRCALDALGAFPELFVDYATRFEAVASFYADDWRAEAAWARAAERAAGQPADRAVLADVLTEQNDAWGCSPATAANIEALRAPDTVAVVTGQQVGLLGGPLYTITKTLTALQLAERMAEATGRTVVPVFWVEGEDHDMAEIAQAHVLERNDLRTLTYAPDGLPENPGAVGRLPLTDDALAPVLDALDAALPPSDFKPDVMDLVHAAYAPGTSIEDAFAKLMQQLFGGAGLVLLNPDDARLKRLVAPLFRRDLTDPETPVARVRSASDALTEAGYHAQVHARPTNLFWLDDARRPIDYVGDNRFVLRDTERSFTCSELLDHLEAAPERFSPNVVLRPLMQDLLLPTTAYVAGPGEVSYFAQYKGVYDWAELHMPLIYPRASVSLVESKVRKVLDKFDLAVPDLSADPEQLFQSVVLEQMDVDVDAVFGDATRQLHQAINALKPAVEAVDRTLVSSAEATRAALMDDLNDLKQRVVRAEKRQQEEVRAQLDKAYHNLRPAGQLQERTLSILYFLNKYSPALIDQLRAALALDTSSHQIVDL